MNPKSSKSCCSRSNVTELLAIMEPCSSRTAEAVVSKPREQANRCMVQDVGCGQVHRNRGRHSDPRGPFSAAEVLLHVKPVSPILNGVIDDQNYRHRLIDP